MQGGCLETLGGGVLACVAGIWKGREREFLAREKREDRGARGGKEGNASFLPSSSRAPRVSLAPKTPFPFPFKRLPRRLGEYVKSLRERHTPKHSEERHPKIGELLPINVIIVRQETEINSD